MKCPNCQIDLGNMYMLNPRLNGRSYFQLQQFIQMIKNKETPLLIGKDFVVMSREKYNKLTRGE